MDKIVQRGRVWRVIEWGLLLLMLAILLCQAYNPLWQGHLQADLGAFHGRATHFAEHQSWDGMSYNEYQPGALWFFVFIEMLAPHSQDFGSFRDTLILVNVLLLVGHFVFFKRYSHRYAPIIFLGLALASGPILLYRFELLVSALALLAWQRLRQKDVLVGSFLLGLSTAVKLYPVFLLPFFVADAARKRPIHALDALMAFALGVGIPVLAVMAFGATPGQIAHSIHVHGLKPIGLENIWTSIIIIAQHAANMPVVRLSEYGIHGIASGISLITPRRLDMLNLVITGLATLTFLWSRRKRGYDDARIAFIVLLLFLVPSRTLNPQYLWWVLVFLPLLSVKDFTPLRWSGVILASLGALLLTQAFYPTHYSEYLAWYGDPSSGAVYFWLLTARNLCLLVLAALTVGGPHDRWLRRKEVAAWTWLRRKGSRNGLSVAIFAGIAIAIAVAFISVFTESYFGDEGYHHSQIQTFMGGEAKMHPALTTIPGFHALLAGPAAFINSDQLWLLRSFNILISIASIWVCFAIAKKLEEDADRTLAKTIQYVFLPILFPFFILLYTDVLSLLLVLAAVLGMMHRRYALGTIAGLLSVCVRQNNIMWFGFLFFLWLWHEATTISTYYRGSGRNLLRFFSMLYQHILRRKESLLTLAMFIIGAVLFAAFIWWNGGIAIGDKSSHPFPTFHLGNIYFLLFLTGFILLPLHVGNLSLIVKRKQGNGILLLALTAIFVIFMLTFANDHGYNQGLDSAFLRNRILTYANANDLRRALFFIPIGLSLA